MKRALLFLAVAAVWSGTSLFAATITLSNKDPRHDNPNLIDRDLGARLRNFGVIGDGSEIYIGSGDLSFSGNRNVGDLIWNNSGPGAVNTFTLSYTPSPALFTMTASGSTSGSASYNFQTPVANPNPPFNSVLIDMHSSKGDEEIRITNLALTITGGATTNLGTIQVVEKGEIFALITDPSLHSSGFTLSGNVFYPEGFQGVSEERPGIQFFTVLDRSQPAMSDLTLTKSHTGNFTQGQMGATYTVTARNIGVGPTTGTVTVVDNFPAALTPTGAGGSGWNCSISAHSATCTRGDALAPGASYPPITLTVNVASTAPPMVINAASVTGGNDGNSANNSVNDPTTIIRGPDVTITKTASGSFTQGQVGAGYTLVVSNTGGVATSGTVTVIDNLPTGLSLALVSGPGWTCGISGNTATCSRSDPLAPGAIYPPINLTVNVASNAPPSVTNVSTVGGGGDLNAANNAASAGPRS